MENERKITTMGMAAGQARLLSITARLSDNELRAQIINNNKMRLASESSQVSDHYVQALNEAELMFANYDADNNASFQKLTFKNMTSYNPYNNQYALTNTSGNVLLSETDYRNYEKCKDKDDPLTEFLKCYGLEKTTTFFDNLAVNEEGKVIFTNPDVEDDPLTEINESANQSTGFTPEELYWAYLGNDEYKKVKSLDEDQRIKMFGYSDTDGIIPDGYSTTLRSAKMSDYQTKLTKYTEARADLLSYVATAMTTRLDQIVKANDPTNKSNTLKEFRSQVENSNDLNELIDYLTHIGYMAKAIESDKIKTPKTKETEDYFKQIESLVTENAVRTLSSEFKTDTATSPTHAVVDDGTNKYIASITKDSSTGKYSVESLIYRVSGSDLLNIDTGTNITDSGFSVTAGTYAGILDSLDPAYTIYQITSSYTVSEDNTPDNVKSVALQILDSFPKSVLNIWDAEQVDYWIGILVGTGNTEIIDAKDRYDKAAQELGECIYGSGYTPGSTTGGPYPPYDQLSDISLLYNCINEQQKVPVGEGKFVIYGKYNPFISDLTSDPVNDFYQVYLNIVLENVQDTYGEPYFTWIDTSTHDASYNENGEAKAQWYTNIFNLSKSNGYRVLKDGLAASPEWMQFAFESGIVNMQQIDANNVWNPLIYSDCSDITSQTSDKMVAQAEAEYSAAMRKIENKDKRYDMELKNIDTEHNSLQTEYESIKSAIDKHVERVFKLYS